MIGRKTIITERKNKNKRNKRSNKKIKKVDHQKNVKEKW